MPSPLFDEMSSSPLQPTWRGLVSTPNDALILFEACLLGKLQYVARRPCNGERSQLTKSGHVFIYTEKSGIKRWFDGLPWSPSRIVSNFLVYRKLEKPLGEKKRAKKRNKRQTLRGEPYPRPDGKSSTSTTPILARRCENFRMMRNLIGSLIDSYDFKEDGLVRRTMSIDVHGVSHHLVSYYKIEDALSSALMSPSGDDRLKNLKPSPDLVVRRFRITRDDVDHGPPNGLIDVWQADIRSGSHGPSIGAWMDAQSDAAEIPAYDRMPCFSNPQYQIEMPNYAAVGVKSYEGAVQAQQQHRQQQNRMASEQVRNSKLLSPTYPPYRSAVPAHDRAAITQQPCPPAWQHREAWGPPLFSDETAYSQDDSQLNIHRQWS